MEDSKLAISSIIESLGYKHLNQEEILPPRISCSVGPNMYKKSKTFDQKVESWFFMVNNICQRFSKTDLIQWSIEPFEGGICLRIKSI